MLESGPDKAPEKVEMYPQEREVLHGQKLGLLQIENQPKVNANLEKELRVLGGPGLRGGLAEPVVQVLEESPFHP